MNVKRPALLALAAASALTGVVAPSAVPALSANSVTGFVSGPIVKVNAAGFQVTTSTTKTGTSTVKLASSTEVSKQIEATKKSLKKGICVAAFGSADSKGKVIATSVTVSAPSKGQCNGGPGGRPGSPPGTSGVPPQPPSASGAPPSGTGFPGALGLAIGKVISIDEQTLEVRGSLAGKKVKRLVSITKDTTLHRIVSVGTEAIEAKLCAFVVGTSSDNSLTVKAQAIRLSSPSSSGCTGFPPRR